MYPNISQSYGIIQQTNSRFSLSPVIFEIGNQLNWIYWWTYCIPSKELFSKETSPLVQKYNYCWISKKGSSTKRISVGMAIDAFTMLFLPNPHSYRRSVSAQDACDNRIAVCDPGNFGGRWAKRPIHGRNGGSLMGNPWVNDFLWCLMISIEF